jgi:hypothetical protein
MPAVLTLRRFHDAASARLPSPAHQRHNHVVQIFDQQPTISYSCGYCQRDVTVSIAWRSLERANGAHVAVCGNCHQMSVFNVGDVAGQAVRPDGASDQFRYTTASGQVPQPALTEYPENIVPSAVGRRFRDAQRAMQRELWEQAISTARTAVQVMARLEEVKRGTLYQEIERLIEKRGTELQELVKQMAHQIRDAGNEALHPDDPNWAPTQKEAEEALTFLRATIEWLYAMPARLKQAEEEAAAEGEQAEGGEEKAGEAPA